MDPKKELAALETQMEGVRSRYISYFNGGQLEPLQYRWQLEANIRRLQKEPINNRMQANRLRALIQKFGNYQALWNRLRREKIKSQGKAMDKEIEDALRAELEAGGLDGLSAEDLGDMDDALADAQAPAEVPVAEPPPPDPAPVEEFQELFDRYVEMRQKNGEPGRVAIAGFQAHLRGQMEMLDRKYPGEQFVFLVINKNGKATLVAEKVPK